MNNNDGFKRMSFIVKQRRYPGPEILLPALEAVRAVMDNEDPAIRPRDSQNRPGGLIFLKELPTVIVPDLHARPGFLETLAYWTPPGSTEPVLSLLEKGEIQVVCLGDGFHSESPQYRRWLSAFAEYQKNFRSHRAMDEEMRDSLQLMLLVMDWKTNYPDVFHFLKGNHENVANENSEENRSFYKFAAEGEMVRLWFQRFLGNETFRRYYEFEKFLPVLTVGQGFCVSHAEPRRYYTREEIINCFSRREIIFDFTWTDNEQSNEGAVAAFLNDYFPDMPQARYYGGHRPVKDLYQLRAGGYYVQIHNPLRYPVVYLRNRGDLENNYGVIYIDNRPQEL